MLTLNAAPRAPHRMNKVRRSPKSSRGWRAYFRWKWAALLPIPWELGAGLTPAERDLIAPSLQVFQQGEAQEGRHFFRCARAYAAASGDRYYPAAHALFMDEEKRHGRDLARFLTLAGIPILTEKTWLTRAFCWCGSRGGLEPTLLVILMSEVLALVYYAALRRVTGSAVLLCICTQILRDEKQHICFQCERLAILRRRRPAPLLALTHAFDALLFSAALLACWSGHRRVLRAGGLSLLAFWRAAWAAYRTVRRKKDPRNYPTL